MNIKAVIFDLDGTLTRYNLDYHLARVKVADELNKLHLGRFNPNTGLTINAMLNNLEGKIPEEEFITLLQRIYRVMEKYELEFAKHVELLPNTRSTLQALKDNGLKTAIVTNNGRLAAKETITRFRISSLIDTLVTRDDVLRGKPDKAAVQEAMNRLNVESDEVVFVGDSIVDIIAARNSDVVSVAIPSGPTSSRDLLETAPDYMIHSISNLFSLIDLIRANTNQKDKKTGN